jgi:ATP-dependent RNA helicase RhlE
MPIAIRELAEMFLTNPETVTVSLFHLLRRMWSNMFTVEKTEKKLAVSFD